MYEMLMKMRREEDEEIFKKIDVGDAPLGTIDLHNLIVPFWRKKDQRVEIKIINKVYGGAPTMLVHLIHFGLKLIDVD